MIKIPLYKGSRPICGCIHDVNDDEYELVFQPRVYGNRMHELHVNIQGGKIMMDDYVYSYDSRKDVCLDLVTTLPPNMTDRLRNAIEQYACADKEERLKALK